MQLDEGILLERARSSDANAIGELYDRYACKIYSYVYFHVRDEALAEDLTANVFIKVLGAIKGSHAWERSFSGWLYRIAHNLIVDHFRRNDQEKSMPLDEQLVAAGEDPVSLLDATLRQDSLRQAMAALTEEQQQVVALKFVEGLSNLEVARIMDKTEGAIKSLQYRALAAMRRYLEDTGGQHA